MKRISITIIFLLFAMQIYSLPSFALAAKAGRIAGISIAYAQTGINQYNEGYREGQKKAEIYFNYNAHPELHQFDRSKFSWDTQKNGQIQRFYMTLNDVFNNFKINNDVSYSTYDLVGLIEDFANNPPSDTKAFKSMVFRHIDIGVSVEFSTDLLEELAQRLYIRTCSYFGLYYGYQGY